MSVSSKTGLVPTQLKPSYHKDRKYKQSSSELLLFPTKNVARPAILSIRPFGTLYNPYAKGCSVLCNHPAPKAVRNVINQVKTNLTLENKIQTKQNDNFEMISVDERDNIPEDLFRRYTDTDSRPLTPSPTITSVRTRTSAGSFLNARRCITPELGKNEMNKRKKIILDLRRSHSQETLCWKAPSEMSQSLVMTSDLPKALTSGDKKRPKSQKSEDKPKTPIGQQEEFIEELKPITCINEVDPIDDDDARRGKKRKKFRQQPVTTTFHLSEDPETQVATLGPDSVNASTRPSLIPNTLDLMQYREKRASEAILLKNSFLTDDAFQALKTELDVDRIEDTFETYLNKALQEAIKYVVPKTKNKIDNDSKQNELNEPIQLSFESRHQKLPRKFSKSATRFEIPLDLKELENMTVMEYLSKYVWVSRQRKYLYKKTFLKYLIQTDDEETIQEIGHEYVERTMLVENFSNALEDVLEFYATEAIINAIRDIVDIENYKEINFRSWCGIVSFTERYALEDPTQTDSCDELEKVDFSSMQERIETFALSNKLRKVFDVILITHNLN